MLPRRQTHNRPVLTAPRPSEPRYAIELDIFSGSHPEAPVASSTIRPRRTDINSRAASGAEAAPVFKAQRPAPGKSATGYRGAALWSSLGFALGIAFWHVIGFWSFIASVVLPAPGERDLTAQRPATQTAPPQRIVNPARATRTLPQPTNAVPATQPAASATAPALNWGTTVVLSENSGPSPASPPAGAAPPKAD